MRYFARSKFSGSFLPKKNFGLIWKVVCKETYFVKGGKIFFLSLSELWEKSWATIIFGKFINKVIIKLLLAYDFRKMFFIGQNHVKDQSTFTWYSFLKTLISFWLNLVNIYCLEFIFQYIKEILYINTNSKENQPQIQIDIHFHLPLIRCWKIQFFFHVALKFLFSNF